MGHILCRIYAFNASKYMGDHVVRYGTRGDILGMLDFEWERERYGRDLAINAWVMLSNARWV